MQRKDIAKTVFRNSIYNIGAQVVNNIVYFFIVVIIARSLSETDFGKYATAKAFTALFVAFCSFGMDFLIIRDISRDARNAPQYLKNSLVLKAVMSLAVFILILTSTSFMNYSRDTTVAIYIFTCVNILGALCILLIRFLRLYKKCFLRL